MHHIKSLTLALCGGLLSLPVQAASAPSLDQMLVRARDHNPEIIEARQAWKVAQEQIKPAGVWPDPTFTYISEKFPSGIPGEAPTSMRHYRVEQMIPFPGKLSGEARMKYHEAIMAEAAYRAKTLDLFRDVRMRYYQLSLTDRKIALAEQSVDLLTNVLKSAQARLAAGRTSASDVFMAETELRKMENNLYQLRQERIVTSIEMNTLLHQPTETPIPGVEKIQLADLPVPTTDFQTLARRNAPEFINAEHEILHSEAMARKNRLAWAPDFGVMAERETAPGGGDPGHQIGLSVTFPLWITRPLGENRAAVEHIEEAKATSIVMENMVLKNVHSETVQTETHLTMARRYETGILPASMSNLRIVRQQYASGQLDFLRMLEAFRAWIEAQNMYQDEIYQYGEHWTELGRWIGMDPSRAKEALEQHELMPAMEMHHDH